MRLGIDASNVRSGGGIVVLSELLSAAQPKRSGIDDVYLWSGGLTAERLPKREWLHTVCEPDLDRGLLRRSMWRWRQLPKRLRNVDADVLLVPGGISSGSFRPFVAQSQNLLPFEDGERQRYGISRMRLRLEIVRWAQTRTFRRADGVLFNASISQAIVEGQMGTISAPTAVVPFGAPDELRREPRVGGGDNEYGSGKPFRWLYVSTVDVYKHQWLVAEAVSLLRSKGFAVALDLVGAAYPPSGRRLDAAVEKWDPDELFIKYHGEVPHSQINDFYKRADGVVYASTCDNISFIVLESMASGLPIACSNRSAMKEILGTAAEYFDPEDVPSIAEAMKKILIDPTHREALADQAFSTSAQFHWEQSARDTMDFISKIATDSSRR